MEAIEAAALVLLLVGVPLAYRAGARRTGRELAPPPPARSPRTPTALETLDTLDEGVIVFDDVLSPVTVNRAARDILGLPPEGLPARLPSDELLSVARRTVATHERVEVNVELAAGGATSVMVRAAPRPNGEGVVLTMRDTSREELVQNMRRQFVNHASHELKTPVASIRTLAEAVRDAAAEDPATTARLAGKLVGEATRLGDLIRDLLELARVEDPGTIANRSVDLSQVIRDQLGQVELVASERGITLTSDIPLTLTVRGDDAQLGLMIRNLLDNALRYTERGGSVSLHARADGDAVTVAVVDDGIGIPLKDQARVFERFYRVDEARSRDHGGTGLGLAIVKHVAGLHGGRVALQSAVGEGSTFTVTLPSGDRAAPRSVERTNA